jgi:Domain of unknown function (DUF3425)
LPSPPSSEESPTDSNGSTGVESTQDIIIVPQNFDTLVAQDFQTDVDLSLFLEGCSSNSSFDIAPIGLSSFTSPFASSMTYETSILQPQSMVNGIPMNNNIEMANTFSTGNALFADDSTIDVPLLKTVKAALEMAKLLGCDESVFDPTAKRTLAPVIGMDIPSWLQPTVAQQQIPHHPFIDLLPWPSVRTKLICVFAQAETFRPPSARDPLAIMKMIADMDDTEEGFRITGDDGLDGENWEIGQAFFNHWWWCLSREIVDKSNQMREKRGAARLKLMPPES